MHHSVHGINEKFNWQIAHLHFYKRRALCSFLIMVDETFFPYPNELSFVGECLRVLHLTRRMDI